MQEPPSSEQIEQLVAASQNGAADAFGNLYDIFIDRIYRYVYFRIGPRDAEDVTELVFLKTWENISQYRPGKSFAAWLFRIAHNLVIDFYRASGDRPEMLQDNVKDERTTADAQIRTHRNLNKDLLSRALGKLKDHYRQIIILKYVNELSNEEIGYITGRSQTAIRILQFRALKLLRCELESMGLSETDL